MEDLCLTDRFIKNTHGVLSPLHELTYETTVSKHEYLTPVLRVEHVVFGEDVDAVDNKASGEFVGIRGYVDYVHASKA